MYKFKPADKEKTIRLLFGSGLPESAQGATDTWEQFDVSLISGATS
jgi:hypothetical protein